MLEIVCIDHIAIICQDYQRSRHFYTKVLGLRIIRETYRQSRQSYKLDLACGADYIIELFSFPNPPPRPSFPEARGLRHVAFAVKHIEKQVGKLEELQIQVEPIRVDPTTGKKFTFLQDPDGLPIELYEA